MIHLELILIALSLLLGFFAYIVGLRAGYRLGEHNAQADQLRRHSIEQRFSCREQR